MHKMVNVWASGQVGLILLSFIFTKSEEFKTFQNIMYDFLIKEK